MIEDSERYANEHSKDYEDKEAIESFMESEPKTVASKPKTQTKWQNPKKKGKK
jgi:hypothetical protein